MSRLYETTHQWMKFELRLRYDDFRFWMLLGECRSKIEHIAGFPMNPELGERMHLLYLAKGVHATTAIEGNTLSESQVQLAIDGLLNTKPSQDYLAQEVRNVLRACNRLSEKVLGDKSDLKITPNLLKYFNNLVRHRLPRKPDCKCRAGKISEHEVVVGSVYRGAPREDCEFLLDKLCEWISNENFKIPGLDRTSTAILKAVVAHLYVAWIHAFCDGNGRTARLMELAILLDAGVPKPVAHLLSNHYNETRDQYYAQLAQASRSGGDVMPFINYAVQGLRDQLAEQIEWIRERQIETAWIQHIGESFPSPPQPKHRRQRGLMEALGTAPVAMKGLTTLSATVARDYAKVSPSTLSRDLAELKKLGLIVIDSDYLVRANRDQIMTMLPERKQKIQLSGESRKRGRGRPRVVPAG